MIFLCEMIWNTWKLTPIHISWFILLCWRKFGTLKIWHQYTCSSKIHANILHWTFPVTNYVYDLLMLLPSNMFKPSGKFPTDRSNLELLSWILFVICVSYFSLSYGLVCSLQVCGHLLVLGKGWPLDSFVRDVFLWFCHFPIWCFESGVLLDSNDSWSLISSLFWSPLCIGDHLGHLKIGFDKVFFLKFYHVWYKHILFLYFKLTCKAYNKHTLTIYTIGMKA